MECYNTPKAIASGQGSPTRASVSSMTPETEGDSVPEITSTRKALHETRVKRGLRIVAIIILNALKNRSNYNIWMKHFQISPISLMNLMLTFEHP